ncbi:hypothetical protein ACFU46_17830 [Streptomyces griseoincarnatus]
MADLYRGWDLHVGFRVRHPAFYMLMYGTVQRGRRPRQRTRPTPCW